MDLPEERDTMGGKTMTNETTIEKLREMQFTAFADAFRKQLKDNSSLSALSFEERLGLLVDIEWTSRKNNRLNA